MPEHKPERKKRKLNLKQAFGLYSYLGKYKMIFIPSCIALFLTAGLALAFPYFLTQLVGDPMDAARSGNIDAEKIASNIDRVVIMLLGTLALQAFISYWRVRGFIKVSESALNDIRQALFGHMVRLPMPYFLEKRPGEVSSRYAADLGVLRDTLLTTVPQCARTSVTLIGGIVFIFIASPKLATIMITTMPVVILMVAIFGRKIRKFSRDAQDTLADSNIVVEESIQGISDVKAFTNEDYEEDRYRSTLSKVLDVTLRGAKARASFISFIIFVLLGTIAGVAWVGAHMLARGEISGENFAMFVLFSIFVGASLSSFPEIISQLQKTAGATERIQEILGETLEEEPSSEKPQLLESGEVELRNVGFHYPSRADVRVLNDVSFIAKPGERIALVGPSGAGKSTVFSLLLGFYQAQQGDIFFDGKSFKDLSLADTRSSMGLVPQEVLLFGGSILENIGYGRPGASKEEIITAAKQANAHEFIANFPEAYETTVGPRGIKLSGGQRQRIAIARAILANPKILLLDEATSALDTASEKLVQEALSHLMHGRTSLIIAHRLSTVRDADRILVLQNGHIVESGTHDELMLRDGAYRILVETQLESTSTLADSQPAEL